MEKHRLLHAALDELVADFLCHTERLPSTTSVLDLMRWSNRQAQDPNSLGTKGHSGGSGAILGSNKPVECATP